MADNDDVFVSEIRGWIEKWEFTEEDVNRVIEVVNKLSTPEEKRKYIIESEAAAKEKGLKPKYQEVPTDEFKEFLESQKVSVQAYMDASQEEQLQLISSFYEKYPEISALKKAKDTTVSDYEEEDTNSSQNSDWKEMRRKAWENYAKENDQPFEEISKAEDADLSMKVGDTPIHYQDKSHLTMGNGEYEKFVQAVKIEKADKTDIINFGNIQSEEYKQKLAAACIQEGMLMSGGPKSIDLSLDCFKNLDDATKAKIEEWNRAQEAKRKEREAEKTQEKPQQSQPEGQQATENQGEQKPVEKDYKKMFDDKVAELKAEKEKNPDYKLDMSQIENTADRVIAFAAAKTAGIKIDKLEQKDSLRGKDVPEQKDANIIISEVRESLPDKKAQNYIRAHERAAFILRRKERKEQEANTQVEVDEVKTSGNHVNKGRKKKVSYEFIKQRVENRSR